MAMVLKSTHDQSSSSMANYTHDCFSYDVFLSFRGEDTRKNFTDHLYKALNQAGIRTFRDDDAMERGRMLKPELEKAIKESAIPVIVFSKSYASSKWCLDEVLMIMEQHEMLSSKHEVVPVFYNIEPSDVRNQTGCFEEAFNGYDDVINGERNIEKKMEWLDKVKAWRASLRKAGALTGMVLNDGYEAKFITEVVNVIRKKLDYKVLYIEDKLVGIANDIVKIESWLQDPSPSLVIAGMGGIGKTTIAKCVYNSNFREFDGSCFLANINETSSQPRGMIRLQSQLLSTILKSEKEETIWNEDEGTNKVSDAICNKRVLLVLDDVTTLQQLDALLGRQRFCPGSKVIVTTRHTWLITAFRHQPKVQTIRTLNTNESLELFSLYAFHRDQPIEPYINQSERVIHHCMGLPLALKVLGSYLRGKNVDEWEDAMRKLEAIRHPGIQKVLQLSYESLEDDNDKDMFLHIACFFVQEDKDYIVKLLAECNLYPVIGIKNLMDRCLLYVENGKIGMHQLIREMGREVVRQESPKDPGKRTRLWHHQDCLNVLQDNTGTEKVEGLMFDMQKSKEDRSTLAIQIHNPRKRSFEDYLGNTVHGNEASFKIGALVKMKNLMLLQINYSKFSGKYKKLPKKLRLLSWHGFSENSIPSDIPLEKLVVLDMSYSKLKRVWDDFKFIGSLKILNLSYSVELITTPDFGGIPHLERLILKGCLSLIEINESITYLQELVLLDITNCRSLRNLPCLPTSLVSLQMSGCPIFGVVGGLQRLDSVSLPSFLVDVNISNCNLFDSSFPNDWSHLLSLEKLKIDGNFVTSLPKCIQTLPRLVQLSVKKCPQIQSILGLPNSTNELELRDNLSLEKVQPGQTRVNYYNCQKLCDMEGRYKLQSVDKVDKKILRYLGLESISSQQEVLYEFGIFSTFIAEEQIPRIFTYKERGSQISFKVRSHDNNTRISGFNLCLVLSQESSFPGLTIEVHNKTKELLWEYNSGNQKKPKTMEKYGWLSLWRCGNLLEDGDEIFIRVNPPNEYKEFEYGFKVVEVVVEECCVNLFYEDDELFEDPEKFDDESNDVGAFDKISWKDRMVIEISDYVHSGKTYSFRNLNWRDYHTRLLDGCTFNLPGK